MKYAVNKEGVAALRRMAAAILDASGEITNSSYTVSETADQYSDVLGPHISELKSALSDIRDAVKNSTVPVGEIADRLEDAADGYEEVIEMELISLSGASSSSAAYYGSNSGSGNSATGSSVGSQAAESASGSSAGSGSLTDKVMKVVTNAIPITRYFYYPPIAGDYKSPAESSDFFTPLLETSQQTTDYDDRHTIYDHPFDDDGKHVYNQGSSFSEYLNTCGLCGCARIINKAGGKSSERSVVGFAVNHSPKMCRPQGFSSERDWINILHEAGIESHFVSTPNLDQLGEMVEKGHGVMIGVDAGILYGEPDYNGEGHAIVIESVIRDKRTGIITDYVISDSNGKSFNDNNGKTTCVRKITAFELEQAFTAIGSSKTGEGTGIVTDEVIW